ncbi:hypothetical protein Tco_0507691 [Tanacetum coccineum]
MNSLRATQSQLKFLTDTLQDFGTMPIFKRTFSQDLDLLEQHITKEIISQTDCKTTLTKLRTTFENAFNSEFKALDLVVIQNTCSEKEDNNSETASSKLVKECSLNSETKDVHAIKYKMSKTKERCMAYFRSLHSHLQFLSKDDLNGTRIEHEFKCAFMSLFGQDVDTFTSTMLLNVDQLQKQLDKDEFQEDGSMAAFWVVNNQFQKIEFKHLEISLLPHMGNVKKVSYAERNTSSKTLQWNRIRSADDRNNAGNDTDADRCGYQPILCQKSIWLRTTFENAFNSEFKERMQKYTRFNAQSFQDAMICNMDSIGKYMLEIILHQQRTPQLLKQKKLMQTQEDHSNPIPALNVDSLKVDLVVIQNTCSEKEDSNSETASSKLVKECSLNSETKDVHAIKYKMSKAKERCMAYFRSLHSHLQVLSKEDLKGTRIEHGFKRAFMSLFGQDVDTFTSTMLLNVDQLQKQLDKDEFQEDGSMAAFWVYERRVNKRHVQTQESKIDTGKAVDNGLVVMESNETASEVQDDSIRSGNDTDADDADIRPIYDE